MIQKIFIVLILFVSTSCSKIDDINFYQKSTANIIGVDASMSCFGCGGYFIKIDGIEDLFILKLLEFVKQIQGVQHILTKSNQIICNSDFRQYTFYSLPEDSNIDLKKADFPIHVRLKWRYEKESFCDIYIKDIEID